MARTMRASSLHIQGRAFNEPRGARTYSQGRMPGEHGAGVAFIFGHFLLATQEKVPRSREASGTGHMDVLSHISPLPQGERG